MSLKLDELRMLLELLEEYKIYYYKDSNIELYFNNYGVQSPKIAGFNQEVTEVHTDKLTPEQRRMDELVRIKESTLRSKIPQDYQRAFALENLEKFKLPSE
jgi:hypothetical protein